MIFNGLLLATLHAPINLVDGHAAMFATMGVIDTGVSGGYYHDAPRKNIHPTRSQATSVADYAFNNLTGWTNISGGTAAASIIADPTPDPAIGSVLDLKTNGTLGSSAGVQRVVGAIPASFGYMTIIELTAVGSNPADALQINAQNSEDFVTMLRFRNQAVELFQDGVWSLLFAHGGAYWTEWWVETKKQLDGSHTVSLLAGTAVVASRNGFMPVGAPGNTNLVWMQQFSGANNYRRSKVAILQVGASQLPDDMTLVGEPIAARTVPAIGHFLALVENVSEDLDCGVNIFADLSQDDGATWQSVALVNRGHHAMGVLDTAKSVRILTGDTAFCGSGQAMRWRLRTTGGAFLPVRGIALTWE